jgi:hypothetical protein
MGFANTLDGCDLDDLRNWADYIGNTFDAEGHSVRSAQKLSLPPPLLLPVYEHTVRGCITRIFDSHLYRNEPPNHRDNAERTEEQKIDFALRRTEETLLTITPAQWAESAERKGIRINVYQHAVWAKLFWQFYGNA